MELFVEIMTTKTPKSPHSCTVKGNLWRQTWMPLDTHIGVWVGSLGTADSIGATGVGILSSHKANDIARELTKGVWLANYFKGCLHIVAPGQKGCYSLLVHKGCMPVTSL